MTPFSSALEPPHIIIILIVLRLMIGIAHHRYRCGAGSHDLDDSRALTCN